jgi:hypothetical protein
MENMTCSKANTFGLAKVLFDYQQPMCRCVVVQKKPFHGSYLTASLRRWRLLMYFFFFLFTVRHSGISSWRMRPCFCCVSKLTIAHSSHHWHLHSRVFPTLKSYDFFSTASSCASLSICNVWRRFIWQNTKCYVCTLFVANIFKCDEPTIHRSKQVTLDTMSKMTELTLKWYHECYQLLTLKYPLQY